MIQKTDNFSKIQEILYLIDTEILHFGHLGAEKIEFEVGRSNFINLENFKFSLFGGGYFNFETQSPIKKMFFFLKYHLTRGKKN